MCFVTKKNRANIAWLFTVVLWVVGCSPSGTHSENRNDGISVEPFSIVVPTLLSEEAVVAASENSLFDFKITNSTSSPTSLVYRGADCGCVGILFEGKPVPPGKEFVLTPDTPLNVSFAIKIPSSVGQFVHNAFFIPEVNGVKTDPVLLQVSGNVLPEISITPPSIQSDFGEGKPIEETKTLTITRNVRANKIPSLPIPLLESLPSSVQIVEIKETTVPTSIADGIFSQSWQATLKISDETVSRNTTQVAQAQVIFPATEYSSICKSSIPVLVRRRIAIDFPEEIAFGICMLGDTVDRKFFIRCTDNRPFRILSAQCSSELFKVKNIPSESGTSFWLEVSFNPLEAGEHQGQLEIETNHPSMKLLQIVLKGLAPKQN